MWASIQTLRLMFHISRLAVYCLSPCLMDSQDTQPMVSPEINFRTANELNTINAKCDWLMYFGWVDEVVMVVETGVVLRLI